MKKDSDPIAKGLVLTRVAWEVAPPACPMCEAFDRPSGDASCEHRAFPFTAPDPEGRGFYGVVIAPQGRFQSRLLKTEREAQAMARVKAARLMLEIVDAMEAAQRIVAALRGDDDAEAAVFLGQSSALPGFESIELKGPPVGAPIGWQHDPALALRLALEQGLCVDPGAAAAALARISKGAGNGEAS